MRDVIGKWFYSKRHGSGKYKMRDVREAAAGAITKIPDFDLVRCLPVLAHSENQISPGCAEAALAFHI